MEWLTFFKFAGIIVSGALGILGTLTETRDKQTHRLTTWGHCALWLTISAFAVALGAQWKETSKHRQDDLDSRKRTEDQIKQATVVLQTLSLQSKRTEEALAQLSRINTRFERISGSIALHMKLSGPGADSFIAKHPDLSHLGPNDENFLPIDLDKYYKKLGTNTADVAEALMLARLVQPILVLRISPNGEPCQFMSGPGIRATFKPTPLKLLLYFPWAKSIQVTWQFDCPKERIETDLRITSVSDLDHARLRLCVLGLDPEAPGVRVGEARLRFDGTAITVGNFQRVPDAVMSFEAVLPSTLEHLAGKPGPAQPTK